MRRSLLAALAVVALWTRSVEAQETIKLPADQDQVANQAMTRLRSPYTASHTVDMCPSAGALRDTIRLAAAEGQSTEEIVEGVIARHGEQLRVLPKRSGPGLWAWLFPPLLLIVGAAVLIRRLRPGDEPIHTSGTEPPLSDDDRERVAVALRDWEKHGEAEG